MASSDVPVKFRRIHKGPIDDSIVFTSLTDLNNYLTNPTRYAGQLVSYVNSGVVQIFALSADENSWQLLKTSNDVVSVNNKTGVIFLNPDDLNDATSAHKFVNQTEKDNFHTHSNKTILDATNMAFTTTIYDQIQALALTEIDGGTF